MDPYLYVALLPRRSRQPQIVHAVRQAHQGQRSSITDIGLKYATGTSDEVFDWSELESLKGEIDLIMTSYSLHRLALYMPSCGPRHKKYSFHWQV